MSPGGEGGQKIGKTLSTAYDFYTKDLPAQIKKKRELQRMSKNKFPSRPRYDVPSDVKPEETLPATTRRRHDIGATDVPRYARTPTADEAEATFKGYEKLGTKSRKKMPIYTTYQKSLRDDIKGWAHQNRGVIGATAGAAGAAGLIYLFRKFFKNSAKECASLKGAAKTKCLDKAKTTAKQKAKAAAKKENIQESVLFENIKQKAKSELRKNVSKCKGLSGEARKRCLAAAKKNTVNSVKQTPEGKKLSTKQILLLGLGAGAAAAGGIALGSYTADKIRERRIKNAIQKNIDRAFKNVPSVKDGVNKSKDLVDKSITSDIVNKSKDF